MRHNIADLLEKVNARLEGRAVVDLIGYHASRATALGTSMKCHCPVHKGATFKTLHIDTEENTAQCVLKECAASKSVTLVELYALAENVSLAEAIWHLATHFHVPLPNDALAILVQALVAEATRHEDAGDLPRASAVLATAQRLEPGNEALTERVAEVQVHLGHGEEARQLYLGLAHSALGRGDLGRAHDLLEKHVLPHTPNDVEALALMADCLRRLDSSNPAWGEAYACRGRVFRDAGDFPQALRSFREAFPVLQAQPSFRVELAELLIALNEKSEAAAELWHAEGIYEFRGDDVNNAHCLERLAELLPRDELVRQKLMAGRARLENREDYLQTLAQRGQQALDAGKLPKALECFEALARRRQDDAGAWRKVAEIQHALGNDAGTAVALAELLRVQSIQAPTVEIMAPVARLLVSLKAGTGHPLEIGALALLAAGHEALAAELLVAAARAMLPQRRAHGRMLLARLTDLEGTAPEMMARAILMLDQQGDMADLARLVEVGARRCIQRNDPAQAMDLLNIARVRGVLRHHPALAGQLGRLLVQSGQHREAVAVWLECHRTLQESGQGEAAAAMLAESAPTLGAHWAAYAVLLAGISPAAAMSVARRFLADHAATSPGEAVMAAAWLAERDPEYRTVHAELLMATGDAGAIACTLQLTTEALAARDVDRAAHLLDMVLDATADDDPPERLALLELHLRVLQNDPELDPGLVGEALASGGEIDADFLRAVLDNHAMVRCHRLLLGDALLAQGKREEALDQWRCAAEEAGEESRTTLEARRRIAAACPDAPHEHVQLAMTLQAMGMSAEARTQLCRAFQLAISDATPVEELTHTYTSLKDRDPANHELTMAYITALLERGEPAAAAQAALAQAELLQARGGEVFHKFLTAAMHLEGPRPDCLRLARLLHEAERQDDATDMAIRALRGKDASLSPAERGDALAIVVLGNCPEPEWHEELAGILRAEGRPVEAARTLERFVSLAESQADHSHTVRLLTQSLVDDPTSLDARRRLVVALATQGQHEEASQHRLALAEQLLAAGDDTTATEIWSEVDDTERESLRGRRFHVSLEIVRGDYHAAAQEAMDLIPMLRESREDHAAAVLLAQLADNPRATADHVGALFARFHELVDESPELMSRWARWQAIENAAAGSAAWVALAQWHIDHGQFNGAVEALESAIPNSTDPRAVLLRLLEVAQKAEIAAEDQVPWRRQLLQIAIRDGDDALALECHRFIAATLPSAILDQIGYARALVKAHREEQARALLDAVLEMARDRPAEGLDAVVEARLELDPNDLPALEMKLEWERAGGDPATMAPLLQRLGDIEINRAHWEKATEYFEEFCSLDDTRIEPRRRLFEIHLAAGNTDRAAEMLRGVYRIQSDRGDLPAAIETLRQLESIDRNNPEYLESLGDLYRHIHDDAQASACYTESARRHAARGEDREALDLTQQVLALDPHNEEIHALRSDIYVRLQEPSKAVEELQALAETFKEDEAWDRLERTLQRLLLVDPEDVRLRAQMANLLSDLDRPQDAMEHFLMLSASHERAGDLEAAIDTANTASTLVPDSYDAQSQLAELYLKTGQHEEASRALRWLVEYHDANMEYETALHHLMRDPTYANSSHMIFQAAKLKEKIGAKGDAREMLAKAADDARLRNEPEMEIRALRSALEMEPGNLELMDRLCASLKEVGRHEEVAAVMTAVFEHLLHAGDYDACEPLAARSVAEAPDTRAQHQVVVDLYIRNEMPELAARELVRMAILLAGEGHPEEALAELEQALSLKTMDFSAMDLRVAVLSTLGEVEEAAVTADEMLEHFNRRGEPRRALTAARHLVTLRPSDVNAQVRLVDLLAMADMHEELPDALRRLADLHLQAENFEAAVQTLRRLLSLRPDDTRARRYYIDSYRQIGEERDLVDDYLKLAAAHHKHGALLEATKTYERALHLTPENPNVHEQFIDYLFAIAQHTRATQQTYELVNLLLNLGTPRRALEVMVRIEPYIQGDAVYHMLRAKVHFQQNARGMAAQQFRKAAAIYAEKGDVKHEVEVLRELVVVDRLDLDLKNRLVERLLSINQRDEAASTVDDIGSLYLERDLADLAVGEFRRAIKLMPERLKSWRLLFAAMERMHAGPEIAADYLRYADLAARKGDAREAVTYYQKVLEHEPANLVARKGLVTQYTRVGKLAEIVDEVIALGQGLVEAGEVDEGIRYFELAMSVDPQNTVARDMLSATQSGRQRGPNDETISGNAPLGPNDETFGSGAPMRTVSAGEFLEGELDAMDQRDNRESLQQVLNNWRDILAVNARNADVRVKLADILEQMGRGPEMLEELAIAADHYYEQDMLEQCAETCERYLSLRPQDNRMRRRLNDAVLKKDALKMLNSSILFSDRQPRGRPGGAGNP